MVRFLAGLAAMGLATAALAAPEAASHPPRVFLSPSGEPFRRTADMPDPLAAWFAQADTGHLGYLDRTEFRADAARFFKKLDENGDGVVDGFEVQDYETKLVPELADWSEGIPVSETPGDHPGHDGRDHGRDAGDHAHGRRGPAISQLISEPEPVAAADFNFDSHITLEEWMRVTDARFDALDKTHAGKLTLEALRARLAPQPSPARRDSDRPPLPPRLD